MYKKVKWLRNCQAKWVYQHLRIIYFVSPFLPLKHPLIEGLSWNQFPFWYIIRFDLGYDLDSKYISVELT